VTATPTARPAAVRHISGFRAHRRDDAAALLAELSLLKAIPAAARLEVVLNDRVDPHADGADAVVHAEFADAAALAAFRAHPLHAIAVRRAAALATRTLLADYAVPDDGDAGARFGGPERAIAPCVAADAALPAETPFR